MSAALSLTPEQLEQLASLTATKLHALLVTPPPKRIERKPRVASAKAAEHVAKKTERYAHLRPGGLHDAAAMTHGAMVAPTMADVIDIGGK